MSGKVIAITGGFGALGRAVRAAALEGGYRVALIDHAPAGPEERDDLLVLAGVDLTDEAQAGAAMARIADRFGGLDALVNVAGGFRWQTLADGALDAWEALYRMNAVSCASACKAALPHLLGSAQGRIVNVGANAAAKAAAGMGPYAASKAAVHRLTESLAEEMKGKVTVNAVLPSIIDTPANRADMPNADFSAWVSPAEVAAAILFLASDAASGVTGALLPVVGRV